MSNNNSERFLRIKSKRDKYEYFSKGILAESLFSIGMNTNQAQTIANQVEEEVSTLNETQTKKKLVRIITSAIEKVDKKLAERYIVFKGKRKYKPSIILLAGVPGIGKSSLAVNLSERLEITNIIGTDMIRAILRQTISSKLIPEIHSSSYEAYKHLKPTLNPILRPSIVGYEEQSRHIIVGVEAAIQSALYSRENTIIEGVHLAPNLLNQEILNDVHVIMILLYLEDEEEHIRRITSRGSKIEQRGSDRYIEAFPEIRDIQTYLVEEATKAKIPIIETSESSKAIAKMMDTIWDRILKIDEKEKD
ncbi:MAG: AAA family ATPase [Candidatus Heimdallarchaeota archaeon]|nr:AAA family ATPase [Candidatus Heimdallarchaeota archaeon]